MVKVKSKKSSLSQLWLFFKPHWLYLPLTLLCLLLQTAGELSVSYYLGRTVDAGVLGNYADLMATIKILLLFWLLSDSCLFARYLLVRRLAARIICDIRQKAIHALSHTRLAHLQTEHSGEFISRLSNDTEVVKKLVEQDLVMLVRGSIAFAASLLMMLTISWRITLVTGITIPVIGLASTYLGKALAGRMEKQQESMAALNVKAQDAASGVAISKAFNLKESLGQGFLQVGTKLARASLEVASIRAIREAVMENLQFLPFFALFGFGGYQVILGRLTMGKLMTLLNLLNNLTWPLNQMASSATEAQAALSAFQRIASIFAGPQERQGGKDLALPPSCQPEPWAIELAGVDFGYRAGQLIFSDLSLRIAPGENIALVGASGSGKSSLLALLLGLREPNGGQIRLFGQDMAQLKLKSIREQMAYVPQETLLFAGSVAENIGYGKVGAPPADIRRAARAALAHGFIEEIPEGYEALLGERGLGLSGGQRQRLALARALVKEAPILLLDEATSALDTETEARVQAGIAALGPKTTTIAIAHRLSAVQQADRIFVLNRGRIEEEGNHQELMALGGIYAALYKKQLAADKGLASVSNGEGLS